MTDEPTLKQYNFLKGKGTYVEGMTKQQAHEAIALIIPAKVVPKTPQTEDAGAEVVKMREAALDHANLVDASVHATLTEKPKKSYELTDGNIRIGALTCAIALIQQGDDLDIDKFWIRVKEFEEYIRNGLQGGTS